MTDRRRQVEEAAVHAATQHEQSQGRQVRSVERVRSGADRVAVADALQAIGADTDALWSFDLLSIAPGTSPRFIEVKGRSTSGPIEVLDREYDLAARVGEHGVLAVVWHAGRPEQQLWTALDWTGLPWQRIREADPQRGEVNTSAFFTALGLRDTRSRSQRALDAEGKWSLTSEDVREQCHRV